MSTKETINIELPAVAPRDSWCERLLTNALAATRERGITYTEHDRLEVDVLVYLTGRELERTDVDNLLAEVLNGLQGQVGGQGKKIMHPDPRVLWNDRQVWKATVQKVERPAGVPEEIGGRVTISPA